MAALSQLSCKVAVAPGLAYYSNNRRRRYQHLTFHHNPRRNYFPITNAPPPPAAKAATTLQVFAYNMRKNNYNNHKPHIPMPPIAKENIGKATLLGAASTLAFWLLEGGGGGNNNAGSIVGGGGGGGGKGGNFLTRFFFSILGLDQEDKSGFHRVGSPVYMLGRLKKYTISEIIFYDRRLGSITDRTVDPLFKAVSICSGETYTRAQLEQELENLKNSGLFAEVDIDCKKNREGTLRVRISFLERTWQQPAKRIRCINVGRMPHWKPKPPIIEKDDEIPDKAEKEKVLEFYKEEIQADYGRRMEKARLCLLPMVVQEEISDMLKRRKNIEEVSARLLIGVRERVQQWYNENGFTCAQIVRFGNMNTEELVCEVVEGDITKIQVEKKSEDNVFDGNGNGNGIDSIDQLAAVVERELPHGLRRGEVFNIHAAERAKLNIHALGLFSNIEIDLGFDEENDGGVIVKFRLEKKGEEFEQQDSDQFASSIEYGYSI